MTSILERLDDLIRGSLHRFVDRALANNSLVMYDQDVRDMETAVKHLEEAAASMYAAARANERRVEHHLEEAAQSERLLGHILSNGEDASSDRAMMLQAELDAQRGLITDTQAQIERQQAQYETLKRTVAETEVTAQTLKDSRPRLESLLVLAEAYRSIERVEMTLDALRGLGGDAEIAIVADAIYQRFGEAQARLDLIRNAENLQMLAELEQAEVEDQLARRRMRLGIATEPEVAEEVSPTPPEVTPKQPTPTEPEPTSPTSDPDEPQTPTVDGVETEQEEPPSEPDTAGTPPMSEA